jgi:hypothetical protein
VSTEVKAGTIKIACCDQHGLHGQRNSCFECGGPVAQIEFVSLSDHRVEVEALDTKLEEAEGDAQLAHDEAFTARAALDVEKRLHGETDVELEKEAERAEQAEQQAASLRGEVERLRGAIETFRGYINRRANGASNAETDLLRVLSQRPEITYSPECCVLGQCERCTSPDCACECHRSQPPTALEEPRRPVSADEVRGILKPPIGWSLVHQANAERREVRVKLSCDRGSVTGQVVAITDAFYDLDIYGATYRVLWGEADRVELLPAPQQLQEQPKGDEPDEPDEHGVTEIDRSVVEDLFDEQAKSVIVDFLDSWRFCPVSQVSAPARSCLEDAAKQLLAALKDGGQPVQQGGRDRG